MIVWPVLALAAAGQRVSAAAAEQARNAFDPARLAAAERLRVANGSEASLEARVRRAVPLIVADETAECVKLAIVLPKNRQPDCEKIARQQATDMPKIPAVIPAMIEQMRTVERRAYAERFTVEEMDAIVAFLQSPAGSKFVTAAGDIDQDVTVKLRLLLRTTLAGTPASADPAASEERP